jgi:hypothetical protein
MEADIHDPGTPAAGAGLVGRRTAITRDGAEVSSVRDLSPAQASLKHSLDLPTSTVEAAHLA